MVEINFDNLTSDLFENTSGKTALENRSSHLLGKISKWFKDPLNFSLFAVMVFAFSIRLYYFILVGNQPLWWDEACYGSLAKNFLTSIWDGTPLILGETIIRPPLFAWLWAALLKLSLPESAVRFFLEFVPSVISVFFVYLIGKEVFDKRVGIISAFVFSTLWIHLFYTVRLLVHMLELLFLFASIYFFIRAIKGQFNYNFFGGSLFLLSIATLTRYPLGIVFLPYLITLIVTKNLHLNKLKFWGISIIALLPLLIFFIFNQFAYGNIFPAFLGGDYIQSSELAKSPFAFGLLSYIPSFLQWNFFIFFLIGFIVCISYFVLGYNLISKDSFLKKMLLILLILISVYSFFIFYMRTAEDRWLFPIVLPLCLFSGFGISLFYNFLKKYNKILGFMIILAILLIGAYGQVNFANDLILNREGSFLQFREAFEWAKMNTPEAGIFAGSGFEPYVIYYAERPTLTIQNDSMKDNLGSADYIILHAFTPQPNFLGDYLNAHQDEFKVLNVWFFDEAGSQPAVVIYQKINSN